MAILWDEATRDACAEIALAEAGNAEKSAYDYDGGSGENGNRRAAENIEAAIRALPGAPRPLMPTVEDLQRALCCYIKFRKRCKQTSCACADYKNEATAILALFQPVLSAKVKP